MTNNYKDTALKKYEIFLVFKSIFAVKMPKINSMITCAWRQINLPKLNECSRYKPFVTAGWHCSGRKLVTDSFPKNILSFLHHEKKTRLFFFFFVFKRLIQFPIINITTSLARFTLVWARILKGNSLLCPNKIANKEWSFNRPSYLLRFIGTAWNREGRTETVLQTTEGKKQLLRFF